MLQPVSRIELFTGLAPAGLCHLEADLSNVLRLFDFEGFLLKGSMENGHEHYRQALAVQFSTSSMLSTCSSHNSTDSFLFISLSC